jgi:hypothetical protein
MLPSASVNPARNENKYSSFFVTHSGNSLLKRKSKDSLMATQMLVLPFFVVLFLAFPCCPSELQCFFFFRFFPVLLALFLKAF